MNNAIKTLQLEANEYKRKIVHLKEFGTVEDVEYCEKQRKELLNAIEVLRKSIEL